jgi:predicted aspartyl protease
MKNESGRRNLALWCGLFSVIYALSGYAVHARSSTSFRLIGNALVVVPVLVNDEGPFEFLLDTGTNTTIITPELARQLSLRTTGNISLITLAGAEVVPRSVLDSLALGTKSIKRLEVLFDELRGVRSVDAKICGVLGQNFLSQFNYLLSYRERYVEFDEDGEMESRLTGTRLAFEQHEGKLVVSSQSTAHGQEALRLVLDSGASHLVLFASACDKLRLKTNAPEKFLTSTSATGHHVTLRRLSNLQLGSERLANLPVALIEDRALPEDRFEDGLLPTSLFRIIFFQNEKHIVILNPRAA